jgi:hypothetical protein
MRAPNAKPERDMPARPIDDVLAAHTDSLMALPGVTGTAIALCDGVPCIRLMVVDSTAARRLHLPTELEGYRVRVDVTGPFRATPRDTST